MTTEQGERVLRRMDRLNVKLPFLQADLSGYHILVALLILCFAAPVVATIYFHHIETEKNLGEWISQRNKITDENRKRLIKIQEIMERSDATQEAVIYMLSLTQDERTKLQLSKPQKIRDLERAR